MRKFFGSDQIWAIAAFGWISVFLFGCIIVPLGSILFNVSGGEGWQAFTSPTVLAIAWVTFYQASLSTLLSGWIGLFVGLHVGTYLTSKPHSRIQTLLVMPYGVPTVVAATAWVMWLGRSGILAQWGFHLDWAYSLKAVITAHFFLNMPWVALAVSQARKHVPQEQIEMARMLGAGPLAEFRAVIWPQVRWAFAGACAQVMSLCTMSFALVLILGGGPPIQTLETELFERLRYGLIDFSGALACGLWELILTLTPWVLVLIFRQKRSSLSSQVRLVLATDLKGRQKLGLRGALVWGVGLFLIFPYFAIVNRQVLEGLVRVVTDSEWRVQVLGPLRTSLVLAGSCSFASVLTAVTAIKSIDILRQAQKQFGNRWILRLEGGLTFMLGIPAGVSVLVLSLGIWMAYGKWIDFFDGSWTAIVALQTTLFFPATLRILWPVAQSTQAKQVESAYLLGASKFKAFWNVEWPRWKGPLFASLAGVAGASLGEVGAVSLFYNEKLIPLPLVVSQWMQQYRFAEAQALAGILFLLSCALIVGSLEMGRMARNGYH